MTHEQIMRDTIYQTHKMGLVEGGNRTTSRANYLHGNVVKYLEHHSPNLYTKYNVYTDKVIKDSYANKFEIDILLCDKVTDVPITAILVKSIISSYNKNRMNYANTTLGETFRILGTNPDMNIIFLTMVPHQAAVYKNDGTLRHMETVDSVNFDSTEMQIKLRNISSKLVTNVYHTKVDYDIVNVDYSSKTQYLNTLTPDKIINIHLTTLNTHLDKTL